MTEEQRQKAKESAVLLALQNEMALMRRDLEMWGMKKDGLAIFISKSDDYDHLWEDTLTVLKEKFLRMLSNKKNSVRKSENYFAFIDNTNVHKGVEMLGWKLDLLKFRRLLKERYGVTRAYMFIGYIEGNQDMYRDFQNMGYTLIFKPTLPNQSGAVKGNCDAELVLQAMIDINDYDKAVIITGDGDFQCLVKHLRKTDKLRYVISPNRKWCSILLKREARENHVFIEEMRLKLELK